MKKPFRRICARTSVALLPLMQRYEKKTVLEKENGISQIIRKEPRFPEDAHRPPKRRNE